MGPQPKMQNRKVNNRAPLGLFIAYRLPGQHGKHLFSLPLQQLERHLVRGSVAPVSATGPSARSVVKFKGVSAQMDDGQPPAPDRNDMCEHAGIIDA